MGEFLAVRHEKSSHCCLVELDRNFEQGQLFSLLVRILFNIKQGIGK